MPSGKVHNKDSHNKQAQLCAKIAQQWQNILSCVLDNINLFQDFNLGI